MRTRREVENLVSEILESHKISYPPVDVEKIAINSGLRVKRMSLPADVSGALIRSNSVEGIALNEAQAPTRQRFTIAHELAHHLLRHKAESEHIDREFTVLRRDGKSSEATDDNEIEANFFAANLLMPKSFVYSEIARYLRFNGQPQLDDTRIGKLAGVFEVSKLAMSYRLVSLGLLNPSLDV